MHVPAAMRDTAILRQAGKSQSGKFHQCHVRCRVWVNTSGARRDERDGPVRVVLKCIDARRRNSPACARSTHYGMPTQNACRCRLRCRVRGIAVRRPERSPRFLPSLVKPTCAAGVLACRFTSIPHAGPFMRLSGQCRARRICSAQRGVSARRERQNEVGMDMEMISAWVMRPSREARSNSRATAAAGWNPTIRFERHHAMIFLKWFPARARTIAGWVRCSVRFMLGGSCHWLE